jgi:DNA (cytosine-5)-methyltransferase 1
MTHGSLFSGIGGFDLAAEWMGWENKFHCEWNPFGQKVLHHYWPEAEQFTDITKSNFKKYANQIDILTGGFPCQPYSQAGKRKGKEDERHLWPEMLRAIREIQPSWVVGENVFGLINWSEGLVFHEVQTDLEAEGYEVWPYVLPAAAVNAPHRRDRVWFVAYSNINRHRIDRKENRKKNIISEEHREELCSRMLNRTNSGTTSNTDNERREKCNISKKSNKQKFINRGVNDNSNYWENFPTVSPICNGDDGISNRLDSITFPKWRNESIKAGGNAIVPQVVYQIFKSIQQYEEAIMQSL